MLCLPNSDFLVVQDMYRTTTEILRVTTSVIACGRIGAKKDLHQRTALSFMIHRVAAPPGQALSDFPSFAFLLKNGDVESGLKVGLIPRSRVPKLKAFRETSPVT
ncbi:MAG: hypothetical protein U0905_19865 [Pirellulales bacterium]